MKAEWAGMKRAEQSADQTENQPGISIIMPARRDIFIFRDGNCQLDRLRMVTKLLIIAIGGGKTSGRPVRAKSQYADDGRYHLTEMALRNKRVKSVRRVIVVKQNVRRRCCVARLIVAAACPSRPKCHHRRKRASIIDACRRCFE